MKVDVEVRGIEELKAELARLSGAVQTRLARNSVMAGARVAAKRAKQLVPVETGALGDSIKATRPPSGLAGQRVALAGSKLFYSRFVELGLPVVKFGQGFASMSPAIKETERLILSGRLAHDGNPVMRWCLANVAIAQDPAGTIKIDKAREKVDGAVALAMAL